METCSICTESSKGEKSHLLREKSKCTISDRAREVTEAFDNSLRYKPIYLSPAIRRKPPVPGVAHVFHIPAADWYRAWPARLRRLND